MGLKYAAGFTRPGPTVFTAVSLAASMALLGLAVRTLPLGTACAAWTGIGTLGAAVLGIALFGEQATPARLFCIGPIPAGIAGLKLAAPG
ncbi:MAG TPA: multidrug efflux SMR transporter [Longimicrobiaceae bacterium]|nr:multidrug efflux SMR transporter [Longimicrobiaceae bacterium]